MSRAKRKMLPPKKENDGGRQIKEKFVEQRKLKQLYPLNDLQSEYLEACYDEEISTILCTGYAGTSKTFIAATIAAQKFYNGSINKIYVIRPAVSNSKSLGYFSGSLIEKALCWSAPIVQVLIDVLGGSVVDIALKNGDIELIPMEVIKGRSLENCWILCDEAEDLTVEEFKKVVTRQGKNSKLILSGDVMQCDLKTTSGLAKGVEMANRYIDLGVKVIDFNHPQYIVRSPQVKKWILAFNREKV